MGIICLLVLGALEGMAVLVAAAQVGVVVGQLVGRRELRGWDVSSSAFQINFYDIWANAYRIPRWR